MMCTVCCRHFVLKRTVLGQMANLNSSTRGSPVHITIRKDVRAAHVPFFTSYAGLLMLHYHLQLSHVYSLFTGWKSLSTLDVRRASVATLDATPIEKSESSRFAGHALSDAGMLSYYHTCTQVNHAWCLNAEGDAVIEPSVSGSGSKTELETPQLEPAVATTLNDELDTDWAVAGESDYKSAGRYSWIFPEDVEFVGTATAQSAALATIVLGLYHTRVAVVSASLVQLEQLIRNGWFNKGA